MQNKQVITASSWRTDNYGSNGSYINTDVTASALHHVYLQTSGYTGPRPKLDVVHNYNLLIEDYTLYGVFSEHQYASGLRQHSSGGILSPNVIGVNVANYPYLDALYNQALDKLTDQVRGDLDISVDLAEAHKTREMFNATRSIENYTKTFVRRFGILKVASNAWLEYTYGIKPLLSTIYGAAEENIRVVLNKTARFRARATDYWDPQTADVPTLWGRITVPLDPGRWKASVTVGVDVRTEQFDPSRWSSLNPVSIAWELMPYSFVVDWFYNVGGYLRNMETAFLNSSKFRSGYKTTLQAGETGMRIVKNVTNTNPTDVSLYTGTIKIVNINRALLTSYPRPLLPSFKASLGSRRLVSAAALLAQHLGRR